jgi:prepilin-type N-terminal cleavage/methylation domain-containing protein
MSPTVKSHRGLTLVEIVVVVAILAILAGAIVPIVSHYAAESKVTATQASLAAVRDAIMGTTNAPGYLGDVGQLPTTMKDLLVQPTGVQSFNRDTNSGWHGPYLLNATGTYPRNDAYGQVGDPAILDAWGNAIVLQVPTAGSTPAINAAFARLVSAGQNGVLDTPLNTLDGLSNPYPSAGLRGDDVVLFVNHSDSDP